MIQRQSFDVATPWGRLEDLRASRLPPGPGVEPEQARRHQRHRLHAAMVCACEEKPYRDVRVADLLALAGVSRQTFYEHFADKEACFVATAERAMRFPVQLVREAVEQSQPGEERARETLEAFVAMVVVQPAVARLCLVESYAAGERATAVVRAGIEELVRLGLRALGEMPERGGFDEDLARAVIGGFYRLIYDRLHQRREGELVEAVAALWPWAMGYQAPSRPLRARMRRPAFPVGEAMAPFAAYSTEQRIIRAFARVMAERGYGPTTIAEICAVAAISRATFYASFEDKDDVLRAALDSSGAQLLAATVPTARRAPDWKRAARTGIGAGCGFLASEPAFARLRAVAVYSAGPEAIMQRDLTGIELLREIFSPSFEQAPEVDPLVAEAIGGAINAILYEKVIGAGPGCLPEVAPLITYVALAPFVESAEACEIALEGGKRR